MLQICCYLTSWTSSGNLTICMQKVAATACIQATNQTSIASPIWILCATMQPNTIFREPGWPGKGTNHTPLACIQPGLGRPGSLVRARLCAEDNQSAPMWSHKLLFYLKVHALFFFKASNCPGSSAWCNYGLFATGWNKIDNTETRLLGRSILQTQAAHWTS